MSNIHLSLRRQSVRATIILFITVFFAASLHARVKFSTAKPVFKDYTIRSKILGEERKYSIYKPPVLPEYAEAVSPVIYVLDGEWLSFYYCTIINYWCERFPGAARDIVNKLKKEQ